METVSRLAIPEARKLRADALHIARAEGWHYDRRNDQHQFYSGWFEGEPFEIAYFYDLAMNGFTDDSLGEGADSGLVDLFELSDIDRQAFDVDTGRTHAALSYSSQGFLSLQYLTAAEVEQLRADYEPEPEPEPEDEDEGPYDPTRASGLFEPLE